MLCYANKPLCRVSILVKRGPSDHIIYSYQLEKPQKEEDGRQDDEPFSKRNGLFVFLKVGQSYLVGGESDLAIIIMSGTFLYLHPSLRLPHRLSNQKD